MEQHGYGRSRYFAYPLPPLSARDGPIRSWQVADRWSRDGNPIRYPADHAAYVDRCHRPVTRLTR